MPIARHSMKSIVAKGMRLYMRSAATRLSEGIDAPPFFC